MTTVVILLLGFAAVLFVSALETDPATGLDVSILQTISDIWNNRVSFQQVAPTGSSSGNNPVSPISPAPGTITPINPPGANGNTVATSQIQSSTL